ncbi:MAG: hypothetical protein AAB447_04100 [Patescibacteria group bacterium]
MKSTLTTRTLLSIVALLSVALTGGYYLLFQEIRERATHTSDMHNQIEEAVGREGYLLSLKTTLADVKNDVAFINSRVIGKDATVTFLDRVEGMAKIAGVTLATDALGVGAAGEGVDGFLEQIGVSFSAEGSYSSLRHFLSLLENAPYSITFSNVSFDRSLGKDGVKVVWHGSFKITALLRK